MQDIFTADENSTPLTPDEKAELKPRWVTLRRELNELEARGILEAQKWLLTNTPKDILDAVFLRRLHKKMFENIWNWAGKYRTTERNIGVSPFQISVKMVSLFGNIHYWIDNKTYNNLEIAVHLHHSLVAIHPFPNGNGRISRIMADLLMEQLHEAPLFWGDSNLQDVSQLRTKYIHALRSADAGDYAELLEFVKR